MCKVAWVISPPTKGSGGFRTICSKAIYLDQHGFEPHFSFFLVQSLIRVPVRLQKKLKTGLGMSQRLLMLSPLFPIVLMS